MQDEKPQRKLPSEEKGARKGSCAIFWEINMLRKYIYWNSEGQKLLQQKNILDSSST